MQCIYAIAATISSTLTGTWMLAMSMCCWGVPCVQVLWSRWVILTRQTTVKAWTPRRANQLSSGYFPWIRCQNCGSSHAYDDNSSYRRQFCKASVGWFEHGQFWLHLTATLHTCTELMMQHHPSMLVPDYDFLLKGMLLNGHGECSRWHLWRVSHTRTCCIAWM